MGKDRLQHLAECGTAELAGAVAALLAELQAAEWEGPEDLIRSYPSAYIDGSWVEINLDEDNPITMLVSYAARCVLIEAAGTRPKTARGKERKRR